MSTKFVQSLIEHLRLSGTGKAKIAVVSKAAEVAKSGDELVTALTSQVPSGTLAKVTAFVEAGRKSTKSTEPTTPE